MGADLAVEVAALRSRLAVVEADRARLRAAVCRERAEREDERLEAALRAYDRGELPPASLPPQAGKWGRNLPIGPFREWLEQLVAAEARSVGGPGVEPGRLSAEQRVAASVGISVRRIYHYRRQAESVQEGVVDACLTHYDGALWVPAEVMYPELGEEAA